MMTFEDKPARVIEESIKTFVKESQENRLGIDGGPIWEEPLVGFADGNDPLFEEYKKIIGPFHCTPQEILEGGAGVSHDRMANQKISVICWVLPMAPRIRAGNRKRTTRPTIRWIHGSTYGEVFNNRLRRYVVSLLSHEGYIAVAPIHHPMYKRIDLPTEITSTWSERHALYVAGMGTFSLSDGFITAKGMAMRCGSVVTNLPLPPSPRVYKGHTDNCPFLVDGSCGDCIDRCPAGAITVKGHDKIKCAQYKKEELSSLFKFYERPVKPVLPGQGPPRQTIGCALCQCGVPCESRIPFRKAR